MNSDNWQTASKKKRFVNTRAPVSNNTNSDASKRSSNQSNIQPTENTSNNTEKNKSSELSNTFSFWFYKKEVGVEDYDKNLRRIGDFHTVCTLFSHLCT